MPKRTFRAPASIALLLALALVLAACGGGSHKAVAKKKPRPRPKPVPHVVVARAAPLSGVPDPTGESFKRPALTVKVENTPDARPLWGVEEADVVYEEVVEGGITRLAVVFNSHLPDKIGPVRSVRRTDQSIVWPIGGIFAYSGGADYAVQSIDTAPVKQIDETRAGNAMFRDHSRNPPHNLYGVGPALVAAGTGATPVPPPPLFTYRPARAKVFGAPAASFVVGFSTGYATTFTWDAKSGTWKRSIFGAPDVTGTKVQLAPRNVVVMFVQYDGLGAVGGEANLTGTGNALVFMDGKEITGTWSRPDKSRPARLLNAKGLPIRLLPGQTWVELPDTSYSVTVTP